MKKEKKEHIPVLIKEVDQVLSLRESDVVVDATHGLGGHSKMILDRIGKNGVLIAFDLDEENLKEARQRLSLYENRIVYVNKNFRNLKIGLKENNIDKVDAILFDLGICSTHVDFAERGFSFMKESELDMRFDKKSALKASDVVNAYSCSDLEKIFREYGEERFAKKIAREICERRKEKFFETTVELAQFIESTYPKRKTLKHHPATKVFQALRIEVNDELNSLKEALKDSFDVLKKGGKIAVISYHSLEDRIVKQFFKKLEKPPAKEFEQVYRTTSDPLVVRINKKPIVPSEKEIEENPRSRSAKLRSYKKII